ncbi:putative G3BP-like protein [Wickerhamomyces ciferrii]|uniref:G3BP-like protein n=1 Tax=Wickerhamomyces ciferrii (strain ATCC 14091 / BCRC 22168 / CBS 111 / JCM 3599 / NBRC 0793 / NRRL Y-1031 F-60-10) TaxID=1206466 RepID=K0KQ90_WICCF|nr:putative G3BP-like protein [Wickerhamomyces ciferrii]CCH44322.1 putative G3BP-like protein [Wickerhamomyces ciferrii]
MSQSSTEAVTYSFVHFYYQSLHENPTKLFQIYTDDANLTHSKIPSNNDDHETINKSIETEQFTNKLEIEKFYSNSNIKNCKVRVSSIDSQSINLNNSILISIIGELALTDESPVYRFTQTFVLVPGKVEKTYDISNDIFRLIPDDDFELNQINNEDEIQNSIPTLNGSIQAEEPSTSNVTEDASITITEANGQIKEESTKEEKIVETPVEKPTETSDETPIETEKPKEQVNGDSNVKTDEKEEAQKEDKEEDKEEPSSKEESSKPEESSKQSEESKPVKAPPRSWADAVISSPSTTSPTTTTPVTKSKPKSKPQSTSTQSPPPSSTQQQQSQSQSKDKNSNTKQQPLQHATNNQNRNKKIDHLYAITVRGIDALSASDVREALEKSFGKTIKVEPRGTFALVSFEEEKAQKEALRVNRLKIKSSVVTIEEKGNNLSFKDKRQNYNNNNNNNNGKNKENQKFNNQNQQKKKTNKASN